MFVRWAVDGYQPTLERQVKFMEATYQGQPRFRSNMCQQLQRRQVEDGTLT